jgi:predicted Zn-dependent peptidase
LSTSAAERTLIADLREILQALGELRTTPLAPSELSGAKARYAADVAGKLTSGAGVASYLADVHLRDDPALDELGPRMAAITADDLRRVAARYLDVEHATIVVQGQLSSSVTAALAAFGEVSGL